MKRLKKITFEKTVNLHEILSKEQMSHIFGGGGENDCLFQAMGYVRYLQDLYKGIDNPNGQAIYAQQYQTEYESIYGEGAADLGIATNTAAGFIKGRFSTVSLTRDTNGNYAVFGENGIYSSVQSGDHIIVSMQQNDEVGHAVVLTGCSTKYGSDGKPTLYFNYYDPQNNRSGEMTADKFNVIHAVDF